MGRKGRRVFRNNYKGHMDKTKRGWKQGREVEMAGIGGVVGGKCRQLYLNNNKKPNYFLFINGKIKYDSVKSHKLINVRNNT